jgi:hypothetical protein
MDVTIKATNETLDITVDNGDGGEQFHYDYPGTLTGADLVDVLAACGIQAEYTYDEGAPERAADHNPYPGDLTAEG